MISAHVGRGDPAIPDLLGVDHHRHPALAGIEAAGGVGPHAALEAALVQLALERLAHRLGSLGRAAPLGAVGRPDVGADEDVALEARHVGIDHSGVAPASARLDFARGGSKYRLSLN